MFSRPQISSRSGLLGKSIILLAVSLGICGCSGEVNLKPEGSTAEVAQTIGTVTFQGKPLANAIVEFHPQGEGVPGTGTTEENGRFAISTFSNKDGATKGFHAVTVMVAPQGPMVPGLEEEYLKDSPIPRKYADASKTPLVVEVKESGNNFDLKIE